MGTGPNTTEQVHKLFGLFDPSLTLTQFCARLKTVLLCRAYETLALVNFPMTITVTAP